MQKMTHEKTWSAPLLPLVPKCTRLLDNKAEVIGRKLNSRDFHVNFISLYKLENCLTHREPDGPLFLWCGRGQSLSLPPTNIWMEISGGIPCRTPYLSFLFNASLPGKKKSFTSPPVRLVICQKFRVFPVQAAGACLMIHNHQEKLSVIPADQTAFTFWWLSQSM